MVADSNNSLSSARNLGTLPGNNGNVTDAFASDSINISDDGSDFYRIQLADTSTLEFELTQGSSVRLALVRDANGNNQIDAGETIISSTNSPFIDGLAAGTYFLQATGQTRPIPGTHPYTFGVRASSRVGQETNIPNDSPLEATDVKGLLNGVRKYTGGLSGGDVKDFFKLQLATSSNVNVFLDRTSSSFSDPSIFMKLFQDVNRDGNLTSSDRMVAQGTRLSNGDLSLNTNITTGGSYFLELSFGGGSRASASYDLTLTGTPNSNFASSSVPQRFGTSESDTIQGNNVGGIISTGRGDDLIHSAGGNDIVLCGAGNDRANGGTGDDLIEGGIGTNQLKGAQGADTFVLNRNGTQIIQDFQDGIDRIGLSQGLVAEVLTFTQRGSDTVIQSGRNSLAVLKNVQASAITGDDFVQISHARSGNLMLPIAVS
jgi:Ca2+-binding RTX toxin-like protein